jgi:hypothetical protein
MIVLTHISTLEENQHQFFYGSVIVLPHPLNSLQIIKIFAWFYLGLDFFTISVYLPWRQYCNFIMTCPPNSMFFVYMLHFSLAQGSTCACL